MDWPSSPGGDLRLLREGSKDWTCIADDEATRERDLLCFDASGFQWFARLLKEQLSGLTSAGTVYVLAGSGPASNLIPGAPGPAPGNEWMANVPPRIAHIPVNVSALDGFTSDFNNGGPWVMWRDTPYAYIMYRQNNHNRTLY